MIEPIASAVRRLLKTLAAKDYESAIRMGSSRLSAQEIRLAVEAYGCTLAAVVPEQLDLIDAIEVAQVTPRRWSVNVPLWTVEEGRSDLTLELTLVEIDGKICVEIDDLHVL